MLVRRVVTGHCSDGRSTIVSDATLKRIELPGVGDLYRVWSADAPAVYPDAGQDPEVAGMLPPIAGIRIFVFTLNAQSTAVPQLSRDGHSAEAGSVVSDDSGFHQADTTDFEVILEGEATLELADGSKVVLKRGDTVIHNGASHRWSNQGAVPAVLAGCMVGARRRQK
jgi:hypothetical protein